MSGRYKSPVWEFFKPDEENKKFAICTLCKAKVSRGSEIAKNQNTKNLLHHLNFFHADKFKVPKTKDNDEESATTSQGLKRPADDEPVKLFSLRSKKESVGGVSFAKAEQKTYRSFHGIFAKNCGRKFPKIPILIHAVCST